MSSSPCYDRVTLSLVMLYLLSPLGNSIGLAANFTWIGNGTNGNWGDPFQWAGFQAPPTNGANTDIFLSGSDSSPDIQGLTNADTDYDINSLTLETGYSGGTMSLTGGELTVDTEITNRHSSELVFSSQINLGDSLLNLRAINGDLDFNAPIQTSLPNSVISVSGFNTVLFDGGITTDTPGIEATLNISSNAFARLDGNTSNLKQVNIDGGDFQFAAFNSFDLLSNANVEVGAGGTFDLNNNFEIIEQLTGQGNVSLGTGSLTISTAVTSAFTYGGRISGTGGLRYFGSNTMSLTDPQQYTGTTIIDNGTIRLAGAGSLASTSLINVALAATLDFNGLDDQVNTIIGDGTIRLGGGTLTFGEDETIREFSGRILEAGELIKINDGTHLLSGNNTFTTLSIQEGTVQVDSQQNLGQGTINLGTNTFGLQPATLQAVGSFSNARPIHLLDASVPTFIRVDATETMEQAGVISSINTQGDLRKVGGGTLILAADNTYRGDTRIDTGTLRLATSDRLPDFTDVVLGPEGTLDLNDHTDLVASLRGIGGAVDTGGPSGRLTVQSDSFGTFIWGGDIIGSGGITKGGLAGLRITTPQSYTGSTVINQGVLTLSDSGSFSDESDITIDSPGTWLLDDTSDTVDSINGDGGIFLGGTATLTVDENSTNTRTFSGVMGGEGNFVKRGTHTLVLSGNNTNTGSTTISAGTLSITNNIHLAAGDLIFDDGTLEVTGSVTNTRVARISSSGTATFDIAANRIFTQAAAINGSQSALLVKRGAGTFNAAFATAPSFHGDVLIEEGDFNLTGPGNILNNSTQVTVNTSGRLLVNNVEDIGSLAGTGTVILHETLRVGHDGSSTFFAGTLTGSGGFGKRGNGVMSLFGNNLYTGITEIDNGTLQLRFGGRLSDLTDLQIAAGASFVVDQLSDTVGSLSGEGDVFLANGVLLPTLGIGGSNNNGTFGGRITGSGDLTKVGTGMQTLSGDWNLFGPVAVEEGTLRIAQGANIEVQDLIVAANTNDTADALIEGAGTNLAILGSLFVGMSSNSQVTIRNQAIVIAEGATTIQSGSLTLDDGTLDNSSGSGITITGGMLQGTGDVIGNVLNQSCLAPGLSAGELSVDGDYTQTINSRLLIELGGTSNINPLAFEYDLLSVTGTADLAGVLEVSLLEDYLPLAGDTFEILTAASIEGVFTTETLPTLAGLDWNVEYTPTSVRLSVQNSPLPGDYNADGRVDAADYTVWRDGNSPDSSPAGYDLWNSNYGRTTPAPARSAAVPEPSACLLLLFAAQAWSVRRRAN